MEKGRHRRYDEEFKAEAIRLAALPGRTTKEVADSLGIHPNQLTFWKRIFKKKSKALRPIKCDDPKDLLISRLEKEVSRLREERDILKKAVGIFSKPQTGCTDS